jgi:hypothetical protein
MGCALPSTITIKEEQVFDSHENNFILKYHTECVFAVRMSSFIHHPKGQLEYTPQNDRLLLECHHQNAKCSFSLGEMAVLHSGII